MTFAYIAFFAHVHLNLWKVTVTIMTGNETKIHPHEASNIIKNDEQPQKLSLLVLRWHLKKNRCTTSLTLLDRKAEILEHHGVCFLQVKIVKAKFIYEAIFRKVLFRRCYGMKDTRFIKFGDYELRSQLKKVRSS